jgi:Predicted amidophosphoribosyltransferases
MATIICPNCGKSIPEGSTICPNCGYHLTPIKAESVSQKSLKKKGGFHELGSFAHLKKIGRTLLKQKWVISLSGILFFGVLFGVIYQYQLHQQEVHIQKRVVSGD